MLRSVNPTKRYTISKSAALTGDQQVTHDNTLLFTIHASSAVFRAPTLTIYQGKSKGSVVASAKLDKGNNFPISFPASSTEITVSTEGKPGDRHFHFQSGGRTLAWQHARQNEVVVSTDSGVSGSGEEKSNPWNWKLVPVSNAASTDDILAIFYHDSAKGGQGAAKLYWFGGRAESLTAEDELAGLAVVLSLEERAKKGQMMNDIGNANLLAGLANGYGAA